VSVEKYDVVVMGCGGFGASAMFHLANRGLRVIGIDRFHPPHDHGSSHGETRIIRKAYFEHSDYVPLLHRAWDLWAELAEQSQQNLIERRDLMMSGIPGCEVTEGARKAARLHNLAIEELSVEDAGKRFPMFNLPPNHTVTVESTAGILHCETCVGAHLALARDHGAQIRFGETVQNISGSPGNLSVRTDRATYSAAAGVLTCGAWSGQLLEDYAKLITVRRKTLFWHPIKSEIWSDPVRSPLFLIDLPEGQFYGFPSVDGQTIKVAEHTGGETIADPLMLACDSVANDEQAVSRFVRERLLHADAKSRRFASCMYSMSPDGHFLFDRLSELPLVVAAGFSGHGFKFSSVLGEAAADLVQQGESSLNLDFLSIDRFGSGTTNLM
jgi:sarcosine oxidase